MYIVRLSLTSQPNCHPTSADAALVHDALWAHATPGVEIQHITVLALNSDIEVVLFLTEGLNDPKRRAKEFVSMASSASTTLRQWHLDDSPPVAPVSQRHP
jgi:hypothetical protein